MKLVKGLVTGMVMGALWAFWWVQTQQRTKATRRKAKSLAKLQRYKQEHDDWLKTLSKDERLDYELQDAQIRSYLRDQLGEACDEYDEFFQASPRCS